MVMRVHRLQPVMAGERHMMSKGGKYRLLILDVDGASPTV